MKEGKEKRVSNRAELSGLYDTGTEFQGVLKFEGSFRIDGYFKGTIESEDTLIIGEEGNVEAEIHVGHAVVNGEFHGRIRCDKKIEVHPRGRVFGTIIAPKIMIDESAYLQAECRTEEAPVSAEPAAEDKESE